MPGKGGVRRRWYLDQHGIRREGTKEKGFTYRKPDGAPVADEKTLLRIRKLRIPPAWREVRIARGDGSPLQAVGVDKKGRTQYLYHSKFRAQREEEKFRRVVEFGESLPALRRRVRNDLGREELDRQRVLAAIVRLIDQGFFRVGNDKSARAEMTYGNGVMHVGEAGRSYLHHTGGMLSFSSSFHVDVASGVGAFASSTINAFAEYRPRLLTRFAVDALTNAHSGRPLPMPPALQQPLHNAASYVGRYSGPSGAFEVRLGGPLSILADGQQASLEMVADEVFRTTHPKFRRYSVMFERQSGRIVLAHFGQASFARGGIGAAMPTPNPSLAKLAGRYINDNPWYGSATVVERGGKLWMGTETPLTGIGDNLWRVGKEAWSPERASFANFIDERPQTLIFSGEKYLRHDI